MARIGAIVAARARAAAGAAPSAAATAAATAADATVATAAAAAAAAAVTAAAAAAAASIAAAAVPWPANGSIAAVGASRLLRRTWLCRWRCHGIPRQIFDWQEMCYLLFGTTSAHQEQVFACWKSVKRISKLSKKSLSFKHALQEYSQCDQAFHICKMDQRGICVFDVSPNKEKSKVTESRFAAAIAAAARNGLLHIGVNVVAAGVRRLLRSIRCPCRFPKLRNDWQHTLHLVWACF